jgi:hypothetical protein
VLSAVDGLVAGAALSTGITRVIQAYSEYVLSQMNPQQYDEILNFNSFKMVSAIKSVVKSSISLSTPLTALEVLTGMQSNIISLNTNSAVSTVKMSLLLTRLLTLPNKLAALVHSNPMIVMLPDISVCASASCRFTLVTQTVDNVTYFDGSAIDQSFVTSCRTGGAASITNHTCSNWLNVTAHCDGKVVQTITSKCPYVITKPTCGRLSVSSSSVTNDICILSSYTSTETTSTCTVPIAAFASSFRRLQEGIVGSELITSGILQVGTIKVKSIVVTPQVIAQPPSLLPTSLPPPMLR